MRRGRGSTLEPIRLLNALAAEWRRLRARPIWLLATGAVLCSIPLLLEPQGFHRPTALLPPLVTLAFVLFTQRVITSMLLGIVVGSALHFGPLLALPLGTKSYFLERLVNPTNLCITGFALSVLSTVKLTEASGGMLALINPVRVRLRSARSTMLGTALLGLLVFFDDYANTMLVGPTLRPITDRQGISREKLAYLVDSTAAPVAGLAIVSTWLGYEVGLLEEAASTLGIAYGGYALLLLALPSRFYCLFALCLVFLVAGLRRDYGPMLKAEEDALTRVVTAPSSQAVIWEAEPRRWLWLNAALPISVLVLATLLGFLIDGGAPARLSEDVTRVGSLEFWQRTLSDSRHGPQVLLTAGLAALAMAFASSLASGALSPRGSIRALGAGLRTLAMPIAILYSAWALGEVCKDLGTGNFLVASLRGEITPVLVPLVTFIAAAMISFATGTSWGTMAILIPAALPLAHDLGAVALVIPTIAAVLDGAIFGDHCSPMSDTTVLSSAACECNTLSHVATQLPYALTAMLVAATAYLATNAMGASIGGAYFAGGAVLFVVVRFVGKVPRASPKTPDPHALSP